MVRGRISDKTKNRYRRAMRDVIKGLSRKVQVYKQPIKKECYNCFYDKVTGRSTGKCKWTVLEADSKQTEWAILHPNEVRYKWFSHGRCPVCKGIGYIETRRRTVVDCLVIWDPEGRYGNSITYTAAGTEGSTLVQLKTKPAYYTLFKNCESIVVDGVECKLSRPPILRGLGTQSVLIISAFTTEKPKLDSGEIIKDYT